MLENTSEVFHLFNIASMVHMQFYCWLGSTDWSI